MRARNSLVIYTKVHVTNKHKREYYLCIHCAGASNAFDSLNYCRIHFEYLFLHISDVTSEYVYANEKLLAYSFMALRFYSKH